MKLVFRVPGAPVSKNEAYRIGFAGGRKGAPPQTYITGKARAWQQAVRTAAFEALRSAFHSGESVWPGDPFEVDHCRISIYKFNTNADHDAGNTLLVDALQFQRLSTRARKEREPWGLYGNDKVVSLGESPRALHNGGAPYVDVVVELLGVVSSLEAYERRARWETADRKRAEKRKANARAKRAAKKGAAA